MFSCTIIFHFLHFIAIFACSNSILVDSQKRSDNSFPNYIRVLNFGRRKTGWLTYKPKKVFVDNLVNIKIINEIWTHKQAKVNL